MATDNNNKNTATTAIALGLFVFYCIIIGFVFFSILKIHVLENFICGLIFELLGTIILFFLIIGNIFNKSKINVGTFVPLVLCTIVYTILLNLFNMSLIIFVPTIFFFLLHFVLLFVYLLIVVPIYLVGKR